MARSLERAVRFDRPGGFIVNMLLFLTAVGGVAFYLSPLSPQPTTLLLDAFWANPGLNGLILAVLAIGIISNMLRAADIGPAVAWVESFRESVDPRRARLPRPPALISAVARLLIDADGRGGRLSAESTRAILDSVGTRMDEGREMGRYLANLLVFLGLLGTFWGLLETVNGVAGVINNLAAADGSAEDAVGQLIGNLREPLGGMGTAFSSSLFGLSGSLVVGFLDLQATQAQGRFYNDLEDWLSGMTETARSGGREGASYAADDLPELVRALEQALAANNDALIKSQAAQSNELRDEIRALNRTLIRFGGGT